MVWWDYVVQSDHLRGRLLHGMVGFVVHNDHLIGSYLHGMLGLHGSILIHHIQAITGRT